MACVIVSRHSRSVARRTHVHSYGMGGWLERRAVWVRSRRLPGDADIRVALLPASRTSTPTDKPFEFNVDTRQIVVRCPWHRWEFSLETGASIGQVTRRNLVTYPVYAEGGEVFVELRPKRPAATRVCAHEMSSD